MKASRRGLNSPANGKMPFCLANGPDRIGKLGALGVEHQPHAVQHHHTLLLWRLDGYKSHRRPRHGLTNRRGLTYWAGIKRTSCPRAMSSRAQ